MDNRPIGVFDSGIGGLTVVDALAKSCLMRQLFMLGIQQEYHMEIKVKIVYSNMLKKSLCG